jgi:hypothetical protein
MFSLMNHLSQKELELDKLRREVTSRQQTYNQLQVKNGGLVKEVEILQHENNALTAQLDQLEALQDEARDEMAKQRAESLKRKLETCLVKE